MTTVARVTAMSGAESASQDKKAVTRQLTVAEKRVLGLVSQAKTNKEIAIVLKISPATVKRHLENIFTKAHLRNRVEAAIYGLVVEGVQAHPRNSLLKKWQNNYSKPDIGGPFGQ